MRAHVAVATARKLLLLLESIRVFTGACVVCEGMLTLHGSQPVTFAASQVEQAQEASPPSLPGNGQDARSRQDQAPLSPGQAPLPAPAPASTISVTCSRASRAEKCSSQGPQCRLTPHPFAFGSSILSSSPGPFKHLMIWIFEFQHVLKHPKQSLDVSTPSSPN